MNERTTEMYERMFAPNPVPQAVVRMYDKAAFFLSRIDAPSVTVRDLAIIAAVAMRNDPETEAKAEAHEPEQDVSGEIPIAEDVPKEPEDNAADEEEFDSGVHIPAKTGIMDAQVRTNKRIRGMSLAKMMQLSMPELRAHAEEFYGCKIPKQFNKSQAAAFLHGQTPIK